VGRGVRRRRLRARPCCSAACRRSRATAFLLGVRGVLGAGYSCVNVCVLPCGARSCAKFARSHVLDRFVTRASGISVLQRSGRVRRSQICSVCANVVISKFSPEISQPAGRLRRTAAVPAAAQTLKLSRQCREQQDMLRPPCVSDTLLSKTTCTHAAFHCSAVINKPPRPFPHLYLWD
jgi:hypothetical protein